MNRLVEQILSGSAWGLSITSVLLDLDLQGFMVYVQALAGLGGVVYFFGIKIPHDYFQNKAKRRQTKLQNKVLQNELDDYDEEETNHKNITNED
jgi:hypothetical protein